MKWANIKKGFTIVELLIVVVVIAILAAITIVAYRGVTDKAKASAAASAASSAAKKVATYAVTNAGVYPTSKADFLTQTGLTETSGTTYEYTSASPNSTFCLTATTNNLSYFVSNAALTPTPGGCPGHGVNGVAAVTNLVTNPSFETISGTDVVGLTATARALVATDTIGALTGSRSAKVTPNYTTTDTFIDVANWGIEASTTYTVMLQYTLTQALPNAYPRFRFNVGGVDTSSPAGPTVVGTHQIRWVYTSPASNTINFLRFMPGGMTGDPSIYIDNFMVVKGNYAGSFGYGASTNWVWNGTANASTSTGPVL